MEDRYKAGYRKEIVDQIVHRILRGECSTLVSLRGCGVRPLFNVIAKDPDVKKTFFANLEVCFAQLDLSELMLNDNIVVLRELLRNLKNSLLEFKTVSADFIQDEYHQGVQTENEHETLYRIKNCLKEATTKNITVVFLLKESDSLSRSDNSVLNGLYSLYYNFKPHVLFVFAVHSRPESLRLSSGSNFDYIFFGTIFMKPYSPEVVRERYRKRFKDKGISLTDKQYDFLYSQTGGLAAYTRNFASMLQVEDLDGFTDKVEEHIKSPVFTAISKGILSDATEEELQKLKQIAKDDKGDIPRQFYDLGIVNSDKKIFSKILADHLLAIQTPDKPSLEYSSGKVLINDQDKTAAFSEIEYKFLQFLAERQGEVCARDEIIEFAWGVKKEGVSEEAVDQLVSRLRAKLEELSGQEGLVKTVRGRGFLLE